VSLRDDVRWVCDAADGLLIGWLPGRLPKWTTKEGEKLGWLVLLLWQKFYDASMARGRLEAEVARLRDDVDGLRTTNERLTDLLEAPDREAAAMALAQPSIAPGFYWISIDTAKDGRPLGQVAFWDRSEWWLTRTCVQGLTPRVLSGRLDPPSATLP
jgi:hypothetical protein